MVVLVGLISEEVFFFWIWKNTAWVERGHFYMRSIMHLAASRTYELIILVLIRYCRCMYRR